MSRFLGESGAGFYPGQRVTVNGTMGSVVGFRDMDQRVGVQVDGDKDGSVWLEPKDVQKPLARAWLLVQVGVQADELTTDQARLLLHDAADALQRAGGPTIGIWAYNTDGTETDALGDKHELGDGS